MARRRKKSGSGGFIGLALAIAFMWLTQLSAQAWESIGIIAGLLVLAYLVLRSMTRREHTKTPAPPTAARVPQRLAPSTPEVHTPDVPRQPQPKASSPIRKTTPPRLTMPAEEPVSVTPPGHAAAAPEFRIPPPKQGTTVWVRPGETVAIAGLTIPGGMLYVGQTLPTRTGGQDPCLIDPVKRVASSTAGERNPLPYWPSYAELTPSQRRNYLDWLAGGRQAAGVDSSYLFLFFYGLERRVIFEGQDAAAREDWPAIAVELRRLLDIYGDSLNTFGAQARRLLDWVTLASHPAKLYLQPLPPLTRGFELPLYLRLALGQAAADSAPIPADLALTFVRVAPGIFLRTAATRCTQEFDALFRREYARVYGAGMVLKANRTKLKFIYQAASPAFRSYNEISLGFGNTPDVAVLTAPWKELQDLANLITDRLSAYSRFVGAHPETKDSPEAMLRLPFALWPSFVQQALTELQEGLARTTLVTTLRKLLRADANAFELSRDQAVALAAGLAEAGLTLEPDLGAARKLPKLDDAVVVYAESAAQPAPNPSPAYQLAALTVDLASAVARADGDFGSDESAFLHAQIARWEYLEPAHIRRLHAHVEWLKAAPLTLTSLKKRIEPLDAATRRALARFMAELVQADGVVAPAEVKVLQKVYGWLGLGDEQVFSDLHASVTRSVGIADNATGFKLDAARIKTLQQETEEVSSLLSGIFVDEPEHVAETPSASELQEPASMPTDSLLGLDETHTTFVRALLSRPQWSREELLEVADDMGLMLDGALEHVNDAAFDTCDLPLTEGDDPISVNTELQERMTA